MKNLSIKEINELNNLNLKKIAQSELELTYKIYDNPDVIKNELFFKSPEFSNQSQKISSSPYSNTGGNFTQNSKKTENTANAKVCIDYLTLSFPIEAFDVPYPKLKNENDLQDASRLAAIGEWLQFAAAQVA